MRVNKVFASLCRTWGMLGLAAALAGPAAADVLTARDREYKGTFLEYRDGKFIFRAEDGSTVEKPRTAVLSIAFDAPRKATVSRLTRGQDTEETLHGYENSRFKLEAKGVKRDVPGLQVRALVVERSPDAVPGPADGAPRLRRSLDVSPLEGRPNLTPAQTSALNRYKLVRRQYEAFAARSGDMVTEADKATGPRRMALLEDLRRRKIEQQTIERDLQTAETALKAAFPEAFAP